MYILGGCHDIAFVSTGIELLENLVVLQVTSLNLSFCLCLKDGLCSAFLNHSRNLSQFWALFANLKIMSMRRETKDFRLVILSACLNETYSSLRMMCKAVFRIPSIM